MFGCTLNQYNDANREYDEGVIPAMLVQETFDRMLFRDVVERVFEAKTLIKV
jgi:hypothetical protein